MSSHPKCGICGRFIKLSELDRKDVYDHSGLSDTIFYHKSCINPPPMPNPTPELPEEIRSTIYQQAKDYSQVTSLDDSEPRYNELKRIGFIEGAFHYAAIAIQLRNSLQEIYDLPGYRQDEASQLASEALALFPVDDKNSKTT